LLQHGPDEIITNKTGSPGNYIMFHTYEDRRKIIMNSSGIGCGAAPANILPYNYTH
jgi:hypothetical protein